MPVTKATSTKNLGTLLKQRREELGMSITQVVESTKMRAEFVSALESGDYAVFASEVYAKGFLRNYSQLLGLDTQKVYAVYRRENSKQSAERKPITEDETDLTRSEALKRKIQVTIDDSFARWFTRKGLGITAMIMLGGLTVFYLISQVNALLAPPYLELTTPVEVTGEYTGELKLAATTFQISGRTSPQTLVRLNADPLPLRAGNEFISTEIPIGEDKTIVEITATNQFGRSTKIKLDISRAGTSVATNQKLDGLVKIQTDVTPLLIRSDGVIMFNDRAFPGDVIEIEAKSRVQIETESPANVLLTINGRDYTLTRTDQSWELVNGDVVEK